jgi:endoplasmic reticulum-Golgi intermediate compartment protein 2
MLTFVFALVLSVDLRDAVGDRLYLSQGFHRDGVSNIVSNSIMFLTLHRPSLMPVKQHHSSTLPLSLPKLVLTPQINREHSEALSARKAIAQSRKSRGFFSIFWPTTPTYRPTYNYKSEGTACRVYGTLDVKKVTGEFLDSVSD